MLVLLFLYVICWLALLLLASMQFSQTKLTGKQPSALSAKLLEDPFRLVLEKLGAHRILHVQLDLFHRKLLVLQGEGWSFEQTKGRLAATLGTSYAILTLSALAGYMLNEVLLLVIGHGIAVVIGIRSVMQVFQQIENRRLLMLTELPNLLSRLMLLVGAGETVQRALARCTEGMSNSGTHPLYVEWGLAIAQTQGGASFEAALEGFNRRCAMQEVSIFTTVLLLNYRMGGDSFVLAMRELSYTLWEKRKAIARMRGEVASSKMVFPLVGMMFVLLLILGSPAFFML